MGWKWAVTVFGLLVAYYAADAVCSSLTMNDYASRPILVFERGETRVAVLRPEAVAAGTPEPEARVARPAGGYGVPLGFSHGYVLPDGARIACTHILHAMWCADGWQAVRAEAPAPAGG